MSLPTWLNNLLLHSDSIVRRLFIQTSRTSVGTNLSVGKSRHLDCEIIERAWSLCSAPILNACEKVSDYSSQRMIGLAQANSGFINHNAFRCFLYNFEINTSQKNSTRVSLLCHYYFFLTWMSFPCSYKNLLGGTGLSTLQLPSKDDGAGSSFPRIITDPCYRFVSQSVLLAGQLQSHSFAWGDFPWSKYHTHLPTLTTCINPSAAIYSLWEISSGARFSFQEVMLFL